mgnify:CR=1 FL=1
MPGPGFDLSGRVALVTGGGRGIGAAIVTRFAEAGATLVCANRTLEPAEELAESLRGRGMAVTAAPIRGLGRGDLAALVDGCADRHGRLDILVHNAGGCPWAELEALGVDGATAQKLAEVGIERVGEVLAMPRGALAARFGEGLLLRIDRALGRGIETIEAVRPVPPPAVERVFEGPTDRVEAIEHTVRGLLGEVAAELARRVCRGVCARVRARAA